MGVGVRNYLLAVISINSLNDQIFVDERDLHPLNPISIFLRVAPLTLPLIILQLLNHQMPMAMPLVNLLPDSYDLTFKHFPC